MTAKAQPIIVIKRKGGHGGHHGGAWKVAYADFVTAMMSLFIVLWLMGSSDKVKRAVAGYFNDPKGTGSQLGTTMTGTGATVSQIDTKDLEKLKDKPARTSRNYPNRLRSRSPPRACASSSSKTRMEPSTSWAAPNSARTARLSSASSPPSSKLYPTFSSLKATRIPPHTATRTATATGSSLPIAPTPPASFCSRTEYAPTR
jgi:flagellar motor protein MotB